jgi:RNA polymerase sigma factor (sigma-70 family)
MDSNRRLALVHRSEATAGPQGVLEDLDDVARLYGEEALRVRKLVRAQVVMASPALVEDACQVAWCRLLIHRSRVRRESARAWLVQVAVHEVLKALARERRERSLEALQEHDGRPDLGCDLAPAMLPTPAPIEDLVELHVRLDSVRALPDRQRRLVWLQGLGLSYREMAGETGMTRRTVERQLMRARSSLAKASA